MLRMFVQSVCYCVLSLVYLFYNRRNCATPTHLQLSTNVTRYGKQTRIQLNVMES